MMSKDKPIKLCRTESGSKTGIVHPGLGAFFRTHAAINIKETLASSNRDRGVFGVNLRTPSVRDKRVPQDGHYNAVELSGQGLKVQVVDIVLNSIRQDRA